MVGDRSNSVGRGVDWIGPNGEGVGAMVGVWCTLDRTQWWEVKPHGGDVVWTGWAPIAGA